MRRIGEGSRAWAVRLIVGVLAAVAGVAVFASGAAAAVRTTTFTYERPPQPRSLNPQTPITQQAAYPQSVTVGYDDQAGTLAVHVALFDAAFWAKELPSIDLAVGESCDETGDPTPATIDASFRYSRYDYTDDDGNPAAEVDASARFWHKDYEGVGNGSVTPAPDGFDVAFQHIALVGIDLRCAHVELPDRFAAEGFFAGYEPFELTKENATREFRRLLGERYKGFATASRAWALCPKEEFFPLTDEDGEAAVPAAICMAQFRASGKWRYVSAQIVQARDGAEFARKPYTRTWTRKWRKLGPTCIRQAERSGAVQRLRGRAWANDGTCPARMLADVAGQWRAKPDRKRFKWIGWYGTNTAGFEKVASWHCKRHGRTVICANALGDKWRWTR